jgi:hypothetical protein
MNHELLTKLFESSTGMTFPTRSVHYEYRSLSASNLHAFAKAVVKECENFTDEHTAVFMNKHFDILDKT